MRIEDASRSFHDQPVEIGGSDCLRKCCSEAVEKIKNQRLFDLDFFLRTLERADPPDLQESRRRPSDQADNEQPEEKRSPHESEPGLLRGGLLMQVLL